MKAFITLPYITNFKKSNLYYIDVLTYVALRSHYNYQGWDCFPSQETLAKLTGMSKPTVVSSIKRLENSKAIVIKRSKRLKVVNHYDFADFEHFNPIPPQVLRLKDLSKHEKAMMLCVRQFFDKETLTSSLSKRELACALGLEYATLRRQYDNLVKKGYILPKKKVYKNGILSYELTRLSDLVDWKYDFTTVDSPKPNPKDLLILS